MMGEDKMVDCKPSSAFGVPDTAILEDKSH